MVFVQFSIFSFWITPICKILARPRFSPHFEVSQSALFSDSGLQSNLPDDRFVCDRSSFFRRFQGPCNVLKASTQARTGPNVASSGWSSTVMVCLARAKASTMCCVAHAAYGDSGNPLSGGKSTLHPCAGGGPQVKVIKFVLSCLPYWRKFPLRGAVVGGGSAANGGHTPHLSNWERSTPPRLSCPGQPWTNTIHNRWRFWLCLQGI